MTIQEFTNLLGSTEFSDATKERLLTMVQGNETITPELAAQIAEEMNAEIDTVLKDVMLDPETEKAIEAEAEAEAQRLTHMSEQTAEMVERNLAELADLDKKIDVLERLHSPSV